MKLKVKLLVAFLLVVFLPISLVSSAASFLLNNEVKSIQRNYNVKSNTMDVIQNPLHIISGYTQKTFRELEENIEKKPDMLHNTGYVSAMNEQLKDKYSFLIIRTENEITFNGNPELTKKVYPNLPKYSEDNDSLEGGLYIGGRDSFLVKQMDFRDSENKRCTLFLVSDVDNLMPEIKGCIIKIFIASFIIICGTALFITGWIHRALIRPINRLRVATCKLKEGDLDYSVKACSKDEIGMLCEDFEEMRLRLKELIETKLQYEKNSKELISNISHDLKTPITAIKGYAEGIMDGVADTPQKRERYLKTIYTKASDMATLVDELSLFTQLDTDTIPYNFVKINLESYFQDCISELMLDLEVKNIDIGYFNYADQNLTVIIDPEQFKRVINNIIGNAVKYMDKKRGIINIRIHENEETVEIEIEDNGKGISEKDLPQIFNRFYRADSSRSSSTGGTGLGLSIAQKIIEDHGGRIKAKSKEHMGTIIYIYLKKELKSNEQNPNH